MEKKGSHYGISQFKKSKHTIQLVPPSLGTFILVILDQRLNVAFEFVKL